MIYQRFLRPLLFLLDPERAHHLALSCLWATGPFLPRKRLGGSPTTLFGLNFRHRVGLAAGLDKNGVALPAWEALGFAFVEIGTVTALPQPGNPQPRIFRYPRQQALINRLGFNNDGAQAVADRLQRLRDEGRWPGIPVGINIGKSRAVELEAAPEDCLASLSRLRDHADYLALNVSSPNTPGLRELQQPAQLDSLLRTLRPECAGKPLLVKVAPDVDDALLGEMVDVCERNEIAGLIATNTTIDHSALRLTKDEQGGLSGAPLRSRATEIVKKITMQTNLPVIGCGGITDATAAREKTAAGAQLLQIYTGFIYRGPDLIRELALAT
ncbi:MAG: quinone-dependent dihydroorotate dehydrogenase [Verrucomicrobiota bacterium]